MCTVGPLVGFGEGAVNLIESVKLKTIGTPPEGARVDHVADLEYHLEEANKLLTVLHFIYGLRYHGHTLLTHSTR